MNFRCDEVTVDGVRNLRLRADRWLTENECDNRDRQAIVLALTEVCTNLVEHSRPAPTSIEVRISGKSGAWFLEISDNGGSFDGYEEAMSAASAIGGETLRDGGLGLHLVGQYFRSCHYLRRDHAPDGLNRLSLSQQGAETEEARARIVVIDDDPVMLKLATADLLPNFHTSAD